ncbi:MAG: hypothetical protein PHX58_10560 [Desulfovibrio sp.]|nr:hypothetical protein [Desulfovibrio sp.]
MASLQRADRSSPAGSKAAFPLETALTRQTPADRANGPLRHGRTAH